jgi:hypothetical protein
MKVAGWHAGATIRTILILALAVMLGACSSTQPVALQQTKNPATGESQVAYSGLLSDYSRLRPGGKDQAQLIYIDQSADWKKYDKIIIQPLECLANQQKTGGISAGDQQAICNYASSVLRNDLSQHFAIVDRPGPDVMILRVALTNAQPATPGLRTISTVVPQIRLLNKVKELATGSYAFVGSAQGEAEVLDSVTHQQIAAWVGRRAGGSSLETAAQWQWGDADNIIKYWAQHLTERLVQLHSGVPIPEQQASS